MTLTDVPLILWVVVVVLTLGWLILVVSVLRLARRLTRRMNALAADYIAVDEDLAKAERTIKHDGAVLGRLARTVSERTDPAMPVVRPAVPLVVAHARRSKHASVPRLPY